MVLSFVVREDVQAALEAGEAVVALESSVIAQGLPYPINIETALGMATAVREGGAVPATIALLAGRIHVGLTSEQITYLGERPSGSVRKCSRRDLPLAMALGQDGATTVAATMIIARRAGIELFATGGIGGVHRGHPFDVSADLLELGRTPVTVVSSGFKSILDIALTREVLETQGVPVLGYGTDWLPAFFTPATTWPVDLRVDLPSTVANIIAARRNLDLQSGMLVTVPVPERAALSAAEVETAVAQATTEGDAAGLHGPAATPWLLQRVSELTSGSSQKANVALLHNNGRIAAAIAIALAGR